MNASRRWATAIVAGLALLASPAAAQYMKITTDNPTDNTRMRASGTTVLTITLDTNHDRDGSLQTCNSHSSPTCGVATSSPLDMFSYTIALRAAGGSVSWGAFTAADPNYTDIVPPLQSDTEIEINQARPPGTVTPAGLVTIGTLPVTVLSGSPSIQLVIGPGSLNPFGFGTGFGTDCEGSGYSNTYALGTPTDPCGVMNGYPGDWFDWDGAASACQDCQTPPQVTAPATAAAHEGSLFSLPATATDADAGAILTLSASGQPADIPGVSVTGPIPVLATMLGTPGFGDAGSYNVVWTATDGTGGTASATTVLTILNASGPPSLNAISNMTIASGGCAPSTADQAISATDPDGDAITFSFSGPDWMSVTSNPQVGNTRTGNIHLTSPPAGTPSTSATVRAIAGGVSDSKTFQITVTQINQGPILNQPTNMQVFPGSTADQTITGTDPCGQALTFIKSSGPTWVTVTTTGPTTGNVHLAPPLGSAGTFGASVMASNGIQSDSKSFVIAVLQGNQPPTLDPIANMIVPEGATADQTIRAVDPDGNPIIFAKVSGPTFMTVTTTSPGIGTGSGNIHLAPGFVDAGFFTATVSASDGSLADSKSFTINVCNGCNRPPVLNPISDMQVAPGNIQDQAISASDADGDALTFAKVAGPPFMTVTTTSPTTGNIELAPPLGTSGTFGATVSASDGSLTNQRSFGITVCQGCGGSTPFFFPVADMTVTEGMTADQTITAMDPNGDPVTFSRVSGPIFMTVSTVDPGHGNATGTIHLAPGLADAGTYQATVRASDGSLSGDRSFQITVHTSGNRCPTANPGGPYSGIVGVLITFDGSASSDPDGNPLIYVWNFGDGDFDIGPVVLHRYAATGTFIVTLTVHDNGDGDPAQVCSVSATTTATIADACVAQIFNGYDTVRLGSGKQFWFAYVQPATGCYVNSDVSVGSFVMKYAGRQIPASGKLSIGGDKSGDGIAEIKVNFSKDDLRTLFTGTGLSNGHNTVTVTIEANLVTGGLLRGTTTLDVVNNGNFTVVTVSPNPLNPEATLTYTTTRVGPVRIQMFDIQGRLVKRIVDDPAMTAGVHEATIDGRGAHGEKLPSGVYYIRGVSSEGEFKKLITILK